MDSNKLFHFWYLLFNISIFKKTKKKLFKQLKKVRGPPEPKIKPYVFGGKFAQPDTSPRTIPWNNLHRVWKFFRPKKARILQRKFASISPNVIVKEMCHPSPTKFVLPCPLQTMFRRKIETTCWLHNIFFCEQPTEVFFLCCFASTALSGSMEPKISEQVRGENKGLPFEPVKLHRCTPKVHVWSRFPILFP